MAVKFIRTCNRCGKVIEDICGDKNNGITYPNKDTYFTVSTSKHPDFDSASYDLCPDCYEDLMQFMSGQLVCDISDREKEDEQDGYVDTDTVGKDGVIVGLDGTVYTQDKDKKGWTGWSPAVLEMARKHNESCEKPKTEVSTSVDKSKIQLKPGTHTYHRWTKEEDQFIAFHSAGMTMNELANKFGVTLKAVIHRKHMILNGKVHVDRED